MIALMRLLLVILVFVTAATGFSQSLFYTDDPIPERVETAYTRGIGFLMKNQLPNGAWGDSYGKQPGVVALAVLAVLAHGEDPNHGPYNEMIKRGLVFILSNANDNGYFGRSMYNHGFSTLALAEAYGAVDDPRLGPALERAVNLTIAAQNNSNSGAWRYNPESTDGDSTVTGAVMVSLLAARNAGVAVPQSSIDAGLKFYTTCQSDDGGIGYVAAGDGNPTRTAIAATVYSLAKKKRNATYRGTRQYLTKANYTNSDGRPFYYLYYASQAYFHMDPELWRVWNRNNIDWLVASQDTDGSWQGQFGSTFSTSAALLALALNYRYLPIYER